MRLLSAAAAHLPAGPAPGAAGTPARLPVPVRIDTPPRRPRREGAAVPMEESDGGASELGRGPEGQGRAEARPREGSSSRSPRRSGA